MAFSATTLTALLRAQVSANIEVPNEPCGVLDGMNLKFDDKGAALGQVIVVPVLPPKASTTATPANVPASGTASTPINTQVTITSTPQQDQVFTGEDLRMLDTIDSRNDILKQWLAQAERAIRNEMATAAANALIIGASRAVGVAGSTPFTTDLRALTTARKILRKNGAPMADVQVAVSCEAYENALNLNVIQKAQESGTDQERRTGLIRSQFGMTAIREDSNIPDHTAGAGTTYVINGVLAKGATAIVLKSGTVNTTGIQIGDIITIEGDYLIPGKALTQYCVCNAPGTSTTATTQAPLLATSGTIYIGNPGLLKATTDGLAATVIKSASTNTGVTGYTPSFVFERHCAVGVIRPPVQVTPNPFYTILETVTDKFGYTYLFGEANQQFQVSWYLWNAYGFAVTQSEFVVPIIGNVA